MSESSNNLKKQIVKVPCYLTFDDGPYPNTGEVLDVLSATQVKATFYLTMKHLERQSGFQFRLIKRMINEGHALGNHGYDHDPQTRSGYQRDSTKGVKNDFTDNSENLIKLFKKNGSTSPGFTSARLPGDGRFIKKYVNMIASEVKLPHVGWNVEFSTNGKMGHITNKNWQGVKGVAGTHSGFPKHNNIILLHDKHWRGKSELLKALINTLKTRCTFLPLGSLPKGLNTIKYVP